MGKMPELTFKLNFCMYMFAEEVFCITLTENMTFRYTKCLKIHKYVEETGAKNSNICRI